MIINRVHWVARRVALSLSLYIHIYIYSRTQLFWFIVALNNSINHSGAAHRLPSFNSHSADCLAAGALNSSVWIFSACRHGNCASSDALRENSCAPRPKIGDDPALHATATSSSESLLPDCISPAWWSDYELFIEKSRPRSPQLQITLGWFLRSEGVY